MSRIRSLPPREWPPTMRQAMAVLRPPDAPVPQFRTEGRPKALNLLGVLAQHPDLALAFHTFNGHVLSGSTLTERQRELIVLRVAHRRGAEYEWRQHAILAGDAGIDETEVARVAEGPHAPGWSELEGAILAAVDDLVGEATIAEETWAVLAGHLSTQQLLDLVFTVGAYEVVAMMLRAFEVDLDEDLAGTDRTVGGLGQ